MVADWEYSYNGLTFGGATAYGVSKVDGLDRPETREDVVDHAIAHGAFIVAEWLGPRRITFEGDIAATDGSDMATKINALRAMFAPQRTVLPLVYKYANEVQKRVLCVPVRLAFPIDPIYSVGYGSWVGQFLAGDPRLYADVESTTDIRTPTQPFATLVALAGNVNAGTHSYKVTFVTAEGSDSIPSVPSNIVTTDAGNGQVDVTIPAGPSGTVSRKIYRTVAGNAAPWKLLATVADNVTLVYRDNIADAGLGISATEGKGTAVATNSGMFPTFPVVQFNGPGTTYQLRNLTSGELWKWSGTLTAAQVLTVDFGARTIVREDGSNQYASLDVSSVWWDLNAGSNTLELTVASGYGIGTRAVLTWRSAWL